MVPLEEKKSHRHRKNRTQLRIWPSHISTAFYYLKSTVFNTTFLKFFLCPAWVSSWMSKSMQQHCIFQERFLVLLHYWHGNWSPVSLSDEVVQDVIGNEWQSQDAKSSFLSKSREFSHSLTLVSKNRDDGKKTSKETSTCGLGERPRSSGPRARPCHCSVGCLSSHGQGLSSAWSSVFTNEWTNVLNELNTWWNFILNRMHI